MLKKFLVAMGVIIVGTLVLAMFKSSDMYVSRELVILKTPDEIFPHINNSQKSYDWMPWKETDPDVKVEFLGPIEGLGSKSSWNGQKMGVGSSEVIESIQNQTVKTKLVYTKPFEMSQVAEVSLTPVPEGTTVKWSVRGQNNYFFKLMSIFVNCDKMIGGEFEKGLSKLKKILENQ